MKSILLWDLSTFQIFCNDVTSDSEQQIRALVSESKAGAEVTASVCGLENSNKLIHMVDKNSKALKHVDHLLAIFALIHNAHHGFDGREHLLDSLEVLMLDGGFWAAVLLVLIF